MYVGDFHNFCYKIIKKPCMRTIIGSSGRDCVLIILFQFCGSKAGLFESNLIWVGQNDPTLSVLIMILKVSKNQSFTGSLDSVYLEMYSYG